jgi:hypothetical protein
MWVTQLRHIEEDRLIGEGSRWWRRLNGARPEERRVAPVVRLVGTGALWWSSRTERGTEWGPEAAGDEKRSGGDKNPTTLGVGLLLWPAEEGEVSGSDWSTWQGLDNSRCGWGEARRWRGDKRRRSDRPGRNGRAFKDAWRCWVQSACGVDVPHTLW